MDLIALVNCVIVQTTVATGRLMFFLFLDPEDDFATKEVDSTCGAT